MARKRADRTQRATTWKRASTRQRTLHVVDADNLTGGPTRDTCVVERAAERYRRAATVQAGGLVAVGTDRRSMPVTGLAWQGALVVGARGFHAVDRSLLEYLEVGRMAGSFPRVVLGSGDGIVAEALDLPLARRSLRLAA
jgi:hypothetical protein